MHGAYERRWRHTLELLDHEVQEIFKHNLCAAQKAGPSTAAGQRLWHEAHPNLMAATTTARLALFDQFQAHFSALRALRLQQADELAAQGELDLQMMQEQLTARLITVLSTKVRSR